MRKFPTGLLAINPRAFLSFFEEYAPPANVMHDGVAVVAVRGALTTYKGGSQDSYEGILERIDAALAKSNRVVVEYDTPGGVCAGLFEGAREIRRRVDEKHATLVAYVRGQACSAGYALACVAHEVWSAPEAVIGSIGVIDALVDATIQDLMYGEKFSVVASGERKADGNPHVETSPEAISAVEKHVAEMAQMFFSHVEKYRAIPAAQVQALQAAIFTGANAQELTLVTRLGSLFECVTATRTMAPPTQEKERPMKTIKEALAAVIAAEGDPAEVEKAKAMLASMEEEASADSEDDTSAEDPPPPADDTEEEDEEDTAASADASTPAAIAAMAAQLKSIQAERKQEKLSAERSALLATRPDLSAGTRKALATASLKEIKLVLTNIPKPLGAPIEGAPTAGSSVGGAGALDEDAQRAFNSALKKQGNVFSIKHEATRATFGGRN